MVCGSVRLFLGSSFSVVTYLYGRAFVHFSYRLGRQAARELIAGTRANLIMKALTILGMFMMGVTAARFVTIQSSLSFVLSEREFALQSILDSILPGILPLSLVMGLYFYFEKEGSECTKRDVIVDCYRWIAGSDRNFINQKEGVTNGENYFCSSR